MQIAPPVTTPTDLLAGVLRGDPAWAGVDRYDTHVLVAAADHHGVGPLVWQALHARRDRPHGLYEALAAARHVDLTHEMLRGREIGRVCAALDGCGVQALLVKGAALAYSLYQEPWLRPRVDTDILVAHESLGAANRVLRGLGYHAAPAITTGEFVSHQVAYALDESGWDRLVSIARQRSISAVCRHGLESATVRLGTAVPARVLATLRTSGREEPSRAYTERTQRRIDVLRADLRLLPRWRDRLQLVSEHAFPPASYMMARYDARKRLLLPALYVHRLASGAWKWLSA